MTWWTPNGVPVDDNDRMPGDLPYDPTQPMVTPPPASTGGRGPNATGRDASSDPMYRHAGRKSTSGRRKSVTMGEQLRAYGEWSRKNAPAGGWPQLTVNPQTATKEQLEALNKLQVQRNGLLYSNMTSSIPFPEKKKTEEERMADYQRRIQAQRATGSKWNWGL